jgi:Na+/proline symporter
LPVVVLVVCDVGLVVLYLFNKAIGSPSEWLTDFVNLAGEANLPTWYASSQLLIVALLVSLNAAATFDRRKAVSWVWVFVAVLFYFISLDEVAQIHERLGDLTDQFLPGGDRAVSALPHTGLWIILIAPPAFAVMLAAFLYLRRALSDQRAAFNRFLLGLLVYFIAAVVIEAAANLGPKHALYILQVCGEEGGELIAATLMVWAAYELVLGRPEATERTPDGHR